MEALTAVAVAALTIYDMVKAVDKAMVIGDIRLIEKRGGRSGEYQARRVDTSSIADLQPVRDVEHSRRPTSSGCGREFPAHHASSTRRTTTRRSSLIAEADVAFAGADYPRAAGGGAAPALDSQSGGRRRRHAVPGDGRESR